MTQPTLVFVDTTAESADLELVVNFGVFSGREATPAEVERLAHDLLDELESVEIICERRYEFARDVGAAVYRVRVEVPAGNGHLAPELRAIVDDWARDCIGERQVIGP
jgi:hypothetical protein